MPTSPHGAKKWNRFPLWLMVAALAVASCTPATPAPAAATPLPPRAWPTATAAGKLPTATPRSLGTPVIQPSPATPPPESQPSTIATATTPADGQQAANLAPDFTLKGLNGNDVTLSDLRGRPVLLNFWATWCPPCRDELPALTEAYEAHKEHGLVVMAVNFKESADKVRAFVERTQLPFVIVLDTQSEVALRYRVRALPSSVFITAEGVIASRFLGPMTRQEIEQHLEGIVP